MQRLHKADMVCIDEGGIGAGVVDRLQADAASRALAFSSAASRSMPSVSADGDKVANRRAEMWAIMREWLQGGMIPDDDQLADDLIGVEYSFNARDEIQLEKKEHMKARGLASPDDGDGLALTFAVPVLPSFIEDDEHWDDSRGDTGY
jgi:hypothetical protein